MNEQKTHIPFRERIHGRNFKSGTYCVALCIAAVAVAVILNVLMGKIADSYTAIDLTAQGLYTLSEQTEQVLASLDEDVTIYLVAQSGTEDTYITGLLDQYAAKSRHVKVVYRDPVLYPGFTTDYGASELAENSLIVESSQRYDVVPNEEIFIYTYGSYYGYSYVTDVQYAGESALTTALDYVTAASLPTVYCLTGHGETAVNDTLAAAIAGDNMTLSDLSLLSSAAVPEDADCLLITAPASDLSADEAAMLSDYLERGGRLLLATSYETVEALPNLLSVLEAYGLTAVPGILLENDTSCCYRYRNWLLPQIADTDVTAALYEGKYTVFVPNAHGVAALDNYRSSITITPLLTTSSDAYAKLDPNNADTMEQTDDDVSGQFNVGLMASETHDGVTTQIIWYGASSLLDSEIDSMVSGADTDLVLASLGVMAGSESSISIHSKTLSTEYLTVPDADASLWSAFFIGVIPALLLLCGAVIMLRRRKR